MNDNPYQAPASDVCTRAEQLDRESPRRIASLSAGFSLVAATVLGMIAVGTAMEFSLSAKTWLSWSPVMAIGFSINAVTAVVVAWAIWKARWRMAGGVFASGLAIFALLVLSRYAMFDW